MLHQHHPSHQHIHDAMEKRQAAQQTVVQIVYKTAPKNFDGPIGGYKTVAAQPANPSPAAGSNDGSDSSSDSSSDSNSDSGQQQQQQQQQQQDQSQNNQQGSQPSQQQQDQQQAKQEEEQNAAAAAAASSQAAQAAAASSEAVAAAISAAMATQQDKAAAATSTLTEATSTPVKNKGKTSSSSTSSKSHSATVASTSNPGAISSTASNAGATSTASHSAAPSSGGSGGLSSGGKAGLAIGILLAIGLLLAGAFLLYRRRKARENTGYSKTDDEKSAFAAGLNRSNTTASTRTTATAPRLSLRPVTEFLPDLANKSKAANAAAAAGGAGAGAAIANRNPNDPNNPFGNHAAAKPPQKMAEDEKSVLPIQGTSENPFDDKAANAGLNGPSASNAMISADAPAPLRIRTPTPETAAAATGAGAAALGIAGLAASKTDGENRDNAPKPLNLGAKGSVTPGASSPATSEFSQTPASPGAMANGPPSNVHRVQLDFKPSMDDELSLRAGQLVRLLHEYDDGWALCIRLDRSQQGVCPRTCLSARPVKPRPPPGARGPGPRGPPPGMMGPAHPRPQSPINGRASPGPNGRQPRPMGPGSNGSQQRSMSPGPYGGGPQRPPNMPPPGAKRRSNSASEVQARRMSPPGPSPMNPNAQRTVQSQDDASITSRSPTQSIMPPRKPVPGQAM